VPLAGLFLALLLLGLTAAPAGALESVRADRGSVAVGGDVGGSITIGLTPVEVRELVDRILSEAGVEAAQLVELATELGVTRGAVETFLRTLGEKEVPIEALPAKLGEIAERHRNLLAQIEQLGSPSPDVQAITERARAAVEQGDYERAEELLAEAEAAALADAERLLLDAAALRAERGELAVARLDYRLAADHFAAAADMVPRGAPLARAEYLNRRGQAAHDAGDYRTAEQAYEEALHLRETHLEPADPDLGTSLNNLAVLYQDTGRYGDAEPLYERALKIDEAALGPDHPDVAIRLNNLAELYRATGRYGDAEPLYERALKITEAALGPDHPNVAIRLNNLAALYHATGRYGEAEPLYERVVKIFEAALGPEHPNVATALNNLALLYWETGRYGEAEPIYERVVKIFEAALGPEHPNVATALNNLALLYQHTGRYGEAEPLHERALKD
jgi:tetratricopeptide (TPR) repeat protein